MNNLPKKIKLNVHGEIIDFSLTSKREIKYYGKTKTSNESLWRTDKLEDNEVFYQTKWGWGVFVSIEERELSQEERYNWYTEKYNKNLTRGSNQYDMDGIFDSNNIPTKLITLTYNNEKIESYE